eukprot:7696908-Prorocentrum_lima.AAC.1
MRRAAASNSARSAMRFRRAASNWHERRVSGSRHSRRRAPSMPLDDAPLPPPSSAAGSPPSCS